MIDKKLILVTGGAGFIGSHLCARLVRDGHRVISLDNYFTGSRENHVPAKAFCTAECSPGTCEVHRGVDYREGHTKDVDKHVPETPDLIYHLGEYSRVAKSLEEPAIVFDLNVTGTFGVLEFWRKKKCKLVYAGSSTKSVGARADGTLGRDLAPYTWGKAANSDLVANYGRWYGLPYAITYFYNVYGPGERAEVGGYGTVVETFRQNYLQGKPHHVRSPGTQKRAFTHVDDTVSGLVLAGEKGEGDGFGIAAAEQYSLLELAQMFGGEAHMLPPTLTTRSEAGDTDTSKIVSLGWRQEKTLPEYIEEAKRQKL